MQVTKGIQIIQYEEKWAKEVARMWNLSRDGWGGDTRIMTEEQVKTREANSDNLQLYLALDGEEVVGYCGLSEYKEDTGSLYIPLLNVRPDYHGRKIGKMLVLQALEKTVELGWPRLDLYTWPGNTKAVPLYKKCGFFWEDRDDVTHLMNFLPLVLNTPLLSPVFNKLDWYTSSQRVIEVKPDGIKEDDFTLYEYSWKNESNFARVQIERTSRGIRLIETDDYFLQLHLKEHEVIEQEELEFQIKFINKTGKPVLFKAQGTGTERVIYDVAHDLVVNEEIVITEPMTVNRGEEPSAWKTHPYVAVTVSIDGQECEMKLGVFPVQPARVEAAYEANLSFLNKRTHFELEIKNHLKEETEYIIQLPESDQVLLETNQLHVKIPASSRKSLSIPFVLKKYGFYNPCLEIMAKKLDGTELSFEQKIGIAFKGLGEKFGGETKEYYHIFNGLLQINIRKRDLLMKAARNTKKDQPLVIFPPKLGRPYTNEFSKKKPESVQWEIDNSSVMLRMTLASGEKNGLFVTIVVKAYGDGIVERWVEIENTHFESYESLAISTPLYHEFGEKYLPLEGEVVHFSENRIFEFGDIKSGSITGNWYFTEHKPDSIGISWSPNSKVNPEGWQLVIEDDLGSLKPGEKKQSDKLTIAIGTFTSWEDFSAFALESELVEKSVAVSGHSLEMDKLIAMNASPLSLRLKSYWNSYLDGSLKVFINEHKIYETVILPKDEQNEFSFELMSEGFEPITILESEFTAPSMTTKLKELIFSPQGSNIKNTISDKEQLTTVEVDNGPISLKAAPQFYPGLYSMKVNGSEWFDHSFPKITAKSWWNPWAGGMKTVPQGLTTFSLLKEKSTATFAEKVDTQGNKWGGLQISTEIQEHADWKGIQFVQYYLMLPGVPVVASYLEVKDTGGKDLKTTRWITDFFLGGEELVQFTMEGNKRSETNSYKAGVQGLPMSFEQGSYISSNKKGEKLYFVPSLYSEYAEAYTNKEVFQILNRQAAIPGKSGCRTAPSFMLFDDRILSTDLLEKLKRIQF